MVNVKWCWPYIVPMRYRVQKPLQYELVGEGVVFSKWIGLNTYGLWLHVPYRLESALPVPKSSVMCTMIMSTLNWPPSTHIIRPNKHYLTYTSHLHLLKIRPNLHGNQEKKHLRFPSDSRWNIDCSSQRLYLPRCKTQFSNWAVQQDHLSVTYGNN